jgi:hypothetical protein
MSALFNLVSRTVGKQDVLRAVSYTGKDKDKIKEIVALSCSSDPKISMKASWVLRYVAKKNQALVKPFLPKIITHLESCTSSCQRSLLNTLEYFEIPEELEDNTYNACFNILLNNASPIANKACSMEILSSICLKYPDLSNELILVIEDLLINGSAGMKSKGKKIIKRLNHQK